MAFLTLISNPRFAKLVTQYLSIEDLFNLAGSNKFLYKSWINIECVEMLMERLSRRRFAWSYPASNPFVQIRKAMEKARLYVDKNGNAILQKWYRCTGGCGRNRNSSQFPVGSNLLTNYTICPECLARRIERGVTFKGKKYVKSGKETYHPDIFCAVIRNSTIPNHHFAKQKFFVREKREYDNSLSYPLFLNVSEYQEENQIENLRFDQFINDGAIVCEFPRDLFSSRKQKRQKVSPGLWLNFL